VPRDHFPEGFLWGAGTSAYQVEGSPLADGAGPSIWHRFAHTPGMVRGGDTGDVACDHYHRWPEDIALMRALGLTAYRFSVSWSRIMPTGRGRVNAAGLSFYERLVDGLLASNIQPLVTLFHWDLPADLDDRGGWSNPDCAQWFADYTAALVARLDDRVRLWATLNEPWVVADGGYLHGALAPGHRNAFEAPRVTHNLLRAHAAAVAAYRSLGRHEIGLVVNLEPQFAASSRAADRAAMLRADAYLNRQYLDPLLLGEYPDELREMFGAAWPDLAAADVATLRTPIDFLGVNYYSRRVVRADARSYPTGARAVRQRGAEHTAIGWEVYPAGLTDVLCWVRDRYGAIPLYVTENGAAFADPRRPVRGVIADRRRVEYLRTHLLATRTAMRRGVDVRGYFAWSLLDNFEWSYGYSKRFGLVHVDFASQRRTLKASATFYAEVIREGRVPQRPETRDR
jgi:beta-glucosidase